MVGLVSLLLFAIAAILNAVMDKTETKISFNSSVFSKKNPLYWSKVDSADHNTFIKGTRRRQDAWHDSKSLMIILLAIAANPICHFTFTEINWLNPIINKVLDLILYGLAWNLTFNLFYNRLFKTK